MEHSRKRNQKSRKLYIYIYIYVYSDIDEYEERESTGDDHMMRERVFWNPKRREISEDP